jgi:hypothetical protein
MANEYNIFGNDFFDKPPQPLYAFTVDFRLSDVLKNAEEPSEIEGDPPDWLKALEKYLKSNGLDTPKEWAKKLGKSVAKIPLTHPTAAGNFPVYFPGYMHTYPGRYDNAGQIQVTFNDNVRRDIRCIIEQMMHLDGMGYRTEDKEDTTRPALPDCLWFDMIVRLYDIREIRKYAPTDDLGGIDYINLFGDDRGVSSKGVIEAFKYSKCYISKIGAEQNTYESSENVRTIEATITYQDFSRYKGV